MMVIMLTVPVVVEAMDAEDKVSEAAVFAVSVDKDDITENKGITLTLKFPAYWLKQSYIWWQKMA